MTADDKGHGKRGFYNVLKSFEKTEGNIKELRTQQVALERQLAAAEVGHELTVAYWQ